ncbi:MAG TPA: hypothetical protein VF914_06455 [Chloroflexia bacterium]
MADDGSGGQAEETVILVNGRDLVDILREYELPMAAGEGSPDIAGGYMGLPPEDVLLPSRHFFGEPRWEVYRYGGKISILDCECRAAGCWPFLARITVDADTVVWSDFEQPHRSPDHPNGGWTYEGLGPFTFAREQYLKALQDAQARE